MAMANVKDAKGSVLFSEMAVSGYRVGVEVCDRNVSLCRFISPALEMDMQLCNYIGGVKHSEPSLGCPCMCRPDLVREETIQLLA